MSGPKSYSVEVFDKQIKKHFLLQSEISMLWDLAKLRIINDIKRNIKITSDDYIAKNKEAYNQLSAPVSIQNSEQLNQNQFDEFYSNIHILIEDQIQFKKKLQNHLARFDELNEAYKYYLEVEQLAEKYATDFVYLKQQLANYLKRSKKNNSEISETLEKVDALVFSFNLPPFDENLAKDIDAEKLKVVQYFDQLRTQLGTLAGKKATNQELNLKTGKVKLVTNSNSPPDVDNYNAENHIIQINNLIGNVTTNKFRIQFDTRLKNLMNGNKTPNKYFFIELIEDIKQHIVVQGLKQSLKDKSNELSSKTFVSSLNIDVNKIKNHIQQILQREVIKPDDVMRIDEEFAHLVEKNNILIREKIAATHEKKFIKARVISAMKDLNYEVVKDTVVLDLEKSDSFLMQIPDQENYLNIRFDESGYMLYNFLMPEKSTDLSYDEKSVKMAEMEQTCDEFKMMLSKLQKRGLNIHLKNEIEITNKALISLPAQFREKLNNAQTGKRKPKKSTKISRKMK